MSFFGIFGKKASQPADQKTQKTNASQSQGGNRTSPQKLNSSQQPSNPWQMEQSTPQNNSYNPSVVGSGNLSNSANLSRDNNQGNVNSFNGMNSSQTQEKPKGMFKNLKTKKVTTNDIQEQQQQEEPCPNINLQQTTSSYANVVPNDQKQNLDNSDLQQVSYGENQNDNSSTSTSNTQTPSKNSKFLAKFRKNPSQVPSTIPSEQENENTFNPPQYDDAKQQKEDKNDNQEEEEVPQKSEPSVSKLSMMKGMKKNKQQTQEETQYVKQVDDDVDDKPYIPSYGKNVDTQDEAQIERVDNYQQNNVQSLSSNYQDKQEESEEQNNYWGKHVVEQIQPLTSEDNTLKLKVPDESKQTFNSGSSLASSEKLSTPSSSKPSFLNKMKQKQAQNNTKTEETPKQQSQTNQRDEKFIMKKINEERITLKDKLTEIVLQQNQLMSKTNYLQLDSIQLKKKLNNLQKEQDEYAENDQFEEAEKLEEVIKLQHEEILQTERSILQSQAEYNQLDNEKEQIFKQEISFQEVWLNQLSDFKKEKLREKERYESEQNQKLKNERYQIEEESERLKITEEHLNHDKKRLDEERDQIQVNLYSQTGEFTSKKDKYLVEKKTLETEIEEIMQQLNKKQKELATVNETLEQLTTKINSIQSKFENQLRRIEQKEQKVNEDMTLFQNEKDELERNISNNDKNKEEFQKKLEEFDQTLENLQSTRNKLSEQILKIKELKENRESALTKYSDSYNNYAQYKSTLQTDEERLEQLNEQKQKVDDTISEIMNKITSLSEKIPSFENEKKTLVSQKKYKQAGIIANDIKELTTQVEEMQKQIETEKQDEKDILLQIEQILVRKSQSDKQLKQLKKAADIDKYQLLLIKIKDLESLHEFSVEQRRFENCQTLEIEIKQTNSEIEQIRKECPEVERNSSSNNFNAQSSNSLEQITSNHKDLLEITDGEENKNENNVDGNEGNGEEQKQNFENSLGNDLLNDHSIGSNTNTMSSQQVTQADLDFQLRDLISKIKANIKKVSEYENDITHLVEAEKYEEADELQQLVDDMNAKIDAQKEKLALNYSCLNLEEAENYLNSFKSEPHIPSESASRDKSGNSPYSENISSQGNVDNENKSEEGQQDKDSASNNGLENENKPIDEFKNEEEEETNQGQENEEAAQEVEEIEEVEQQE